jgi:hypothetical protein
LYRSASASGAGAVDDDFFDVARLKAALAKALVAFYPLAGRLGVDTDGRPQIDCAGQGVFFVVAHSALTADELSRFQPSPELKRLFVPRVEDYSPSLMCGVQVNFLKCGGVALGVAMHHIAVDAIGAFHFFRTWSAFCRDGDAAATALAQYATAHVAINKADVAGGWENAVKGAIATDNASANAKFQTYAQLTASALTSQAKATSDGLDKAGSLLLPAGILIVLAGLLAAVGAWWGVTLRLDEYR